MPYSNYDSTDYDTMTLHEKATLHRHERQDAERAAAQKLLLSAHPVLYTLANDITRQKLKPDLIEEVSTDLTRGRANRAVMRLIEEKQPEIAEVVRAESDWVDRLDGDNFPVPQSRIKAVATAFYLIRLAKQRGTQTRAQILEQLIPFIKALSIDDVRYLIRIIRQQEFTELPTVLVNSLQDRLGSGIWDV